MMPFWVNSEILVPGANRPLLVPVSHAEYEWYVRGPKVNADVAFYFGIDGKAEFRTMDELNQPWVLSRHAHTYTGPKALEVTRLTSAFVITYIHAHKARPNLPFGGYYALGVCQDAIAAIENKLTGHATLFPNTADITLFNDPRDAEINQLIAAIPKDRDGARPTPERIFGSLPTEDLHAITIPGLASDLIAAKAAWQPCRCKRDVSGTRCATEACASLRQSHNHRGKDCPETKLRTVSAGTCREGARQRRCHLPDQADWVRREHLAETAIARFGHFDKWVNNAGLGRLGWRRRFGDGRGLAPRRWGCGGDGSLGAAVLLWSTKREAVEENTGVLLFVQDDAVKRATARATATP